MFTSLSGIANVALLPAPAVVETVVVVPDFVTVQFLNV